MIIISPPDQLGVRGKRGSRFTGEAYPYLTFSEDGVTVNTVTFTPGARTYWHVHEAGQVLQVLAGRGLVQARGGPVQILRAGDTVWSPPGEEHWHGAAPDSVMTHTAISLGATHWSDQVVVSNDTLDLEETQS